MSEIIKWLIKVEELARNFYHESGLNYFTDNKNLSNFLLQMSDDETYHYNVMKNAYNFIIENRIDFKSDIILDDLFKNKILFPLKNNLQKLKDKTLTEEDMFNCLLTTEFSEWNDIFIYVLNLLAGQKIEFQIASSNMQRHLSKLEYFFNSSENLKKYYNEMIKIPRIWTSKILIIDDEKSIRDLLISLFQKYYYYVDVAENGEEGYNKIQNKYYNVIISDVDMPLMSGIEMFEKITENNLLFDKSSIIFISGSLKHNIYFEKNNLKLINKPFLIGTIINEVSGIINK